MMKTVRGRFMSLLIATSLSVGATACGHSDEEMQALQREIDGLKARLRASNEMYEQEATKHKTAQSEIDDLRSKMQQDGVKYASSEEERKKLKQALAEYEQRVKQLEEMKARFRDLRARLDKLTSVGLKVVLRNNRMVIQLPGDILFASGHDDLTGDGRKVLKQVADIFKGDETLRQRQFQVAGHTDNMEYGPAGPFRDNWGLSLARTRSVVLFLTGPENPKIRPNVAKGTPVGGGLDPQNWSASGYGTRDPIAGSVDKQTADEMKRNRRVELVLQPNVEEMLNLKDIDKAD